MACLVGTGLAGPGGGHGWEQGPADAVGSENGGKTLMGGYARMPGWGGGGLVQRCFENSWGSTVSPPQ